ncbi:MAG TPA: CBS domain-containing protein [Pyrinomonadaceae bacterium]|nr:CBS domain-containing protein [Pyrinomonadaceae bacterium]
MSRYRDEPEDDYYGGRMRDRDFEERYERGRYGERGGPAREGRDYEERRPEQYRDRDYFRGPDYGTGAVGRYGERADYERRGYYEQGRGIDDDRRREDFREGFRDDDRRPRAEDDREGRSLWEEGREYLRRRGRGEGRAPGRGRASRSHLRCRDIMTRDVTVATRETTLEEVARMMRDEDTGVIPVVDRAGAPAHTAAPPAAATDAPPPAAAVPPLPSPLPDAPVGHSPEARRINADIHGNGRLAGLITDRDIVVRAVAEGRDTRTVRAEEIMTADVHTAQPNDRVIDAIRKMGDKQVRRIPIVDREGTLRGIISMADVALETDDDRELAEALEEISSGSSFWSKIFG